MKLQRHTERRGGEVTLSRRGEFSIICDLTEGEEKKSQDGGGEQVAAAAALTSQTEDTENTNTLTHRERTFFL